MSLRLRLILALVGLVAAGLLIADLVTFFSLQSFLVRRVDQQLVASKFPIMRALADTGQGLPGTVPSAPPGETPLFPPGTYGEVLDSSGSTVIERAFIYGGSEPSPPSLPADVTTSAARAEDGQLFFTASATGHSSERYRVMAAPLGSSGYTFVAAIPLTDVTQTLGRLVFVEIIVTLGVLAGLGALAWWLVRRELRPLDDMAVTAGAIAAGDLTRRVEPADAHTEVGRLGLALNTMLAQIERAFAERQASEQALRRFLAQASHELRTPLASIRGYAELFRRGAKERPEDLELAMRRIEQEGARMGALVEELLLLARLDEGRPLERGPVDLRQVAIDAVADAKMVQPDRDVRLEPDVEVSVIGDEARLRQVAANLVTNALQHAGAGARVRVGTTREDGWAVLEVSDDGSGMSDEVAAHAFERFFKGVPADGADESGSGLGLSIVAAIAASLDGDVGVRTAPGEGACFRVRLPLAQPGAVTGAAETGTPAGETAPDGAAGAVERASPGGSAPTG